MREEKIGLWKVYERNIPEEVCCVTTNGVVNSRGLAVMGRGTAGQAADKFPGLRQALGNRLATFGNRVFYFPEIRLITFPVKPTVGSYHHLLPSKLHLYGPTDAIPGWAVAASPFLIQGSLRQLEALRCALGLDRVYLPRPGCGAGGLSWKDVQPHCAKYGDWLVVIDRSEGRLSL